MDREPGPNDQPIGRDHRRTTGQADRAFDRGLGAGADHGRAPRVGLAARDAAFGTPAAVADDAEVRGFRLGWKASLLLTLILLAMPLGLVIAVPPVMACRERAERLGFFAGDTLQACIEHGIAQRLTRLEQRVTMLVRGSGR